MNEPSSVTLGWLGRFAQSWLPVCLLGVSLGANVYLGIKMDHPAVVSTARIKLGDRFPVVAAETLAGNQVRLGWASNTGQTVIYVFSPTCIWCARNLANIQALALNRGSRFRFIGVSLTKTGLHEYLAKNNLPFPIYSIDAKTAKETKLTGTPEMIVVSREGKVERDISGAFTGPTQKEVEAAFDIHLPGLLQKSEL